MTSNRALGIAGEDAAAAWYESNGYQVLARNWRCTEGELDLVVRNRATIVFCEVKARTTVAFGAPVEAVTPAKQRRLRTLASRWLAAHRSGAAAELRFDVVSVLAGDVEVIEAAF